MSHPVYIYIYIYIYVCVCVCVCVCDIDDSVVCRILKFADDTKIYSSVGSAKDIDNLQSDL